MPRRLFWRKLWFYSFYISILLDTAPVLIFFNMRRICEDGYSRHIGGCKMIQSFDITNMSPTQSSVALVPLCTLSLCPFHFSKVYKVLLRDRYMIPSRHYQSIAWVSLVLIILKYSHSFSGRISKFQTKFDAYSMQIGRSHRISVHSEKTQRQLSDSTRDSLLTTRILFM